MLTCINLRPIYGVCAYYAIILGAHFYTKPVKQSVCFMFLAQPGWFTYTHTHKYMRKCA